MTKKLNSKALPGIFMALSVIAAILFRSCRVCWVFMAVSVGFNLPALLFSLMIVFSALHGALFALKLYKNDFCDKKAYKILLLIGAFFSSVLFIFSAIYTVGYAPGEEMEIFSLYLGKTLKEGAFLLLVPFFVIFYPKLSCKAKKAFAAVSLSVLILFSVNAFFPLSSYKITSDPLVIDNGTEYSVIFSTNDIGTACVEYTYEGKAYKVFDNTCGRLNGDSRIHSIPVPYEHLKNNSYKVSSTRVIEEYGYGSRRGETVSSGEYEFKVNETESQTWLVISDWHTWLDKAYKAIDNFGTDYDGVILLGDASPTVDFEKQAVTNTVEFGGKVSGGTKPVLYVRGNHETRGDYANDMPTALGLDQLYYTSDIGPYSFVVLDSGEDKEDSHVEYGGMNDYDTYRADMIEWLKGVELENEKVITISHSWQISDVEPELSAEGWAELDRLGTRFMLSGHHHDCRILGENEGYEKQVKEKYPDIIAYLDGGKMNDGYVASMLTLNAEGFELKAVDDSGNEILKEEFPW